MSVSPGRLRSAPFPAASTPGLVPGPLRVEGVSVSAGGVRILDGVDLALHPGEMCALIGPSGAGKSTLIRVLLGLRDPSAGSVRLGARTVEEAGTIGYVPQDDALHRGLTVRAELLYAAELRLPGLDEATREARVGRVLAQVGLTDRSGVRIRRLSGGQRKRVAVALELLTAPPLLILDEPTSGLDPGLEARTMALLADVADTGRTVLVATHAMGSLDRVDALCVLVRGHVAYFGPPRTALDFFRVDRYGGLFQQLDKQSPAAWRVAARNDPAQRRFLSRPAPFGVGVGAGSGRARREGEPITIEQELDRMRLELARTDRS